MLDIKFVRENLAEVKKALEKKHSKFDLDGLLALDDKRKKLLQKVENLRAEQKKISSPRHSEERSDEESHDSKRSFPADSAGQDDNIKKAKAIKEELKRLQPELEKAEKEYSLAASKIHNIPHPTVPAGPDETGNKVERMVGKKPEFSFKPKDHFELGKNLDLIDMERATKISGTRFAFLKNELFELEFALVRWLTDLLKEKGFTMVIPPVLVKERAMQGSGFFPAEEGEYYAVGKEDKEDIEDKLYLAGTSEVPLVSYHADEILTEKELPKKYAAFSSCFRREAGSYGKDTRGIMRLHQFDKIEMVKVTVADDGLWDADSWKEYEELLAIAEEILQKLGLHYRVMLMCGGDIGMPNAKKFDTEVWLPGAGEYRELQSCSHDTDFQARRLKIRYKNKKGETKLCHTMNSTALAIGRTLVAIMENYQQEDGSILVPEILKKYLDFDVIKKSESEILFS